MDTTKLKQGRDYFATFSPNEQPYSKWIHLVEIKVQTSEHTYATMYIYIFVHLTKPEIQELCSSIIRLHFPDIDSYDTNVNNLIV